MIDRLEMRQVYAGPWVAVVEAQTYDQIGVVEHAMKVIGGAAPAGVRRISPTTYVVYRRERPSLPTDSSLLQ
jgi:hypothetical protein